MKKRILGAALILVVFLPLILVGGEWFAFTIGIIGVLGLKELCDIRFKQRRTSEQLPLWLKILSYACLLVLTLNNWTSTDLQLMLDYRVLSSLLIVFFFPVVFLNNQKKYNLEDAMYLLGGVIFLGLSFNLIILLRNYSLLYLLYLFLITTMTDTFALFTGMLIGKHKLAEKISPKKTIEGLVGGTVMGVFIASVFYLTAINSSANILSLVLVTTVLSLVGQVGDLVFSAIKRHYAQKDFSNLIPGHGGILDRFDSIIFVVITVILFISII